MELEEAIKICKKGNKWRRYNWEIGEWPQMPEPKKFGEAIDLLIENAENIEAINEEYVK